MNNYVSIIEKIFDSSFIIKKAQTWHAHKKNKN